MRTVAPAAPALFVGAAGCARRRLLRPLPFDAAYRAKPMTGAIVSALSGS